MNNVFHAPLLCHLLVSKTGGLLVNIQGRAYVADEFILVQSPSLVHAGPDTSDHERFVYHACG